MLRANLGLLLGVLESSPPTYHWVDAPPSTSILLGIPLLVLSPMGTLALATAVLAPAHLWYRFAVAATPRQ